MLNPVTALEFYHSHDDCLLTLAGEGSYLKVFDARTQRLIGRYRIFGSQTIHGIAISERSTAEDDLQIVIWGGSHLTFINNKEWDTLLSMEVGSLIHLENSIPDWIMDIALSPDRRDRCVLVTAHNALVQASIDPHSGLISLLSLDSPSKSVLYSAAVTWFGSTVSIAAGTVFGEIIAWECTITEPTSSSTAQVLHTLSGHEGSIFGVDMSLALSDESGNTIRLLASCSDDRTIRIWDISNSSTSRPSLALENSISARETGFGHNNINNEDTQSSNRCLGMIMGHASRIWKVKFLQFDSKSVQVLSFGEDATAQHWIMDLEDGRVQLPTRLRHLNTFAFHTGKHLWSSALSYVSNSSAIVATGGSDGKVSSYTVALHPRASTTEDKATEGLKSYNTSKAWELDLEEVLIHFPPSRSDHKALPEIQPLEAPTGAQSDEKELGETKLKKPKAKKAPKDAFNRYALVEEDLLLVSTQFGRVFTCKMGTPLEWKEISLPEFHGLDLKSYCVAKGLPEAGVAFATGTNGNIFIYQGGTTMQLVGKLDRKVTDMFPFVIPGDNKINLLAATLGGEVATLYQFDQAEDKTLTLNKALTLLLPDKFVVTSSGYCNGFLILGSRNGTLAVYESNSHDYALASWRADDAEKGDAITSITAIDGSVGNTRKTEGYVLTTGRNGLHSVFCISTGSIVGSIAEDLAIFPVHHGTPPFGPNIEAGWFEGTDLLLYGFRSKQFVVWNETKQCEIATVECGGAHRSFAYSQLKGVNGGCYFIYTKASKLHIYHQSSASHKIVKQGGHGREIKACAVSADGSLLATGAEDTLIRLWSYNEGKTELDREFVCLAVRQQHTAGMQHLQWHGQNYLLSSGGVEEFYIWSISHIPGFGVGIVCEASCPDPSEEKDLRIMSFDVSEAPEHMRLEKEEVMLIHLAYSDSTIRSYVYSKSRGFRLVATGRYTTCCLMQIKSIPIPSGEMYLITAATDGKLVVWRSPLPQNDTTTNWQMVSAHTVHQNSIKCMDVVTTEHEYIAVATGGDDNAWGSHCTTSRSFFRLISFLQELYYDLLTQLLLQEYVA